MSELNEDEILFGKAAVLLEYITPQQLQEALKHKEEFAKVQLIMNVSQILVNKNYIEKKQVQSIRDYATKLPPQIKNTASLAKESFHGDYQKKIGRYFIISTVGQGAMGEVFKAYDPHLDRIIALKILSNVNNHNNIERFQREARTMAQLTHPSIVAVYDISNEDNQYFFAMDLIEGCTLDELLQNETLDYENIVNIMLKIADAIDYAHSHGVIHRDLKPSNILMEKKQEPKITDFGLAKVSHEEQKLSQSGMIIGTLQYMPPEQASGKIREVDQRSDIYSLGAILYEMITNFPPFSAPTFNQLIRKITKEYPILPRGIRSDIPKNLEAICLKALNKKREQRYQTAKEFIFDLKAFKSGDNIQASSIHIQKILLHKLKQRNILLPLAISVVSICIFIFAFFIISFRSDDNTGQILLEIGKLSKEITASEKILASYDSKSFAFPSPQIKIQIESTLISLVQMDVLLQQILATNSSDLELKQKKLYNQGEIHKLSVILNNFFLTQKQNSEIVEWQEKTRKDAREKLSKIVQYLEKIENDISSSEINIYVNDICKFPAEQISDFLASNINSSNKNVRYFAIRSLGKLQAPSIIANGINVQQKLLEDLQYFLNENDTETSIEIVEALALMQDSSLDKKIYSLREKYKQNYSFYNRTQSAYEWIPISLDADNDQNLALRYFAKGKYETCISILEKEEQHKLDAILAASYYKIGDLEKAITFTRKTNFPDSLYNLEAEILLNNKDYDALLANKETLFHNKWQEEYYLGVVGLAQNKNFLFGSPFIRLINQFPQDYSLHLYQGIFSTKEKRYYEAISSFNKAIEIKPDIAKTYFYMAMAAFGLKDINTALFYFEKTLSLDPHYEEVHFYLGKSYYLWGNWTKAIFEFTRAVEKNPDDKDSYYFRGKIYLKFIEQQENKRIAIGDLSRAIDIDNHFVDALFLRGKIYVEEQRYAEAVDDLTNALQYYNSNVLESDVAEVYITRATAYSKMMEYDLAINDVKKARKYSNSPEIKRLYKQILKEKKIAESEK